jgi:hypothetical protein
MLTTGIVQYLLTQSSVTSSIAGGNAIQPLPSPTDPSQYPCIVYQQVSETPDYSLTGNIGLAHSRVVFDVLAPQAQGGYLTAKTIALAVKQTFDGYEGTLPDGTRVFISEVVSVQDGFQADALLSRTTVHVMFHYQY